MYERAGQNQARFSVWRMFCAGHSSFGPIASRVFATKFSAGGLRGPNQFLAASRLTVNSKPSPWGCKPKTVLLISTTVLFP